MRPPPPMHFNEAFDPFRALKSAWILIKKSPASLLVGGCLFWVCDIADEFSTSNFGGKFDYEPVESWREVVDQADEAFKLWLAGATVVFALLAVSLYVATWLFRSLLRAGFARVVERALIGDSDDLGELFNARGRWASVVGTTFSAGLLSILALLPGIALGGLVGLAVGYATGEVGPGLAFGNLTLLAYLPVWLYVVLGLSLSAYAASVEGMTISESISRSWYLVRGHRWVLLLYWIVMGIVELTCCCSCGCLLFLPKTFSMTATYDAYLRLVKGGDPSTWNAKPAPRPEPVLP